MAVCKTVRPKRTVIKRILNFMLQLMLGADF